MDEPASVIECTELRPRVRQIRMNRPDRLNAIDDAFIAAFHRALDDVEADPTCRVVVVTGAGRGFCAGFDMVGGDYEGDPTDRHLSALMAGQRRLSSLAVRLHELPHVVIAAINGPAAGGGMALALAADIRVAAEEAFLVAANVKIGVSGGEMGMTWRLPRLIGEARAAELLLTGRRLPAAEAHAIGLVAAVAGSDQLIDRALAIADDVLATSAFGTRMTKELLDANAAASSLRHAIQNEDRTQVLCNFTGDVGEAVAAFREGRPPEFA
jgi:enoyl-CoA hydratase